MSMGMLPELHRIGTEELKKNWGWFLALGIILAVIGTFAFIWSVAATILSVEIFGWLLLIGGILSVAHAFLRRRWGGFFIDLLAGVLYVVVGFMVVGNPAASAVTLTLLMALFLFIGGIFRVVVALTVRFSHRGWMLFNGVINVVLGVLIWSQWPLSGLWVIGLFVGIDLIFYGWSLIMLGLSARNASEQPT